MSARATEKGPCVPIHALVFLKKDVEGSEAVELMVRDAKRLLCLDEEEFWELLLLDTTLAKMIDSVLVCSKELRLKGHPLLQPILSILDRCSQGPEEESVDARALLWSRVGLFHGPALLDLCHLYGRTNVAAVRSILGAVTSAVTVRSHLSKTLLALGTQLTSEQSIDVLAGYVERLLMLYHVDDAWMRDTPPELLAALCQRYETVFQSDPDGKQRLLHLIYHVILRVVQSAVLDSEDLVVEVLHAMIVNPVLAFHLQTNTTVLDEILEKYGSSEEVAYAIEALVSQWNTEIHEESEAPAQSSTLTRDLMDLFPDLTTEQADTALSRSYNDLEKAVHAILSASPQTPSARSRGPKEHVQQKPTAPKTQEKAQDKEDDLFGVPMTTEESILLKKRIEAVYESYEDDYDDGFDSLEEFAVEPDAGDTAEAEEDKVRKPIFSPPKQVGKKPKSRSRKRAALKKHGLYKS